MWRFEFAGYDEETKHTKLIIFRWDIYLSLINYWKNLKSGHIDTVKELLVLGSNWKCTNNQSENTLDILSIFEGEESRQEIEHFIVEINECNLKPAKKSD